MPGWVKTLWTVAPTPQSIPKTVAVAGRCRTLDFEKILASLLWTWHVLRWSLGKSVLATLSARVMRLSIKKRRWSIGLADINISKA